VKAENDLGRSLIIDLEDQGHNKYRQVDHRSIESIILKNVKYVLKKKGKPLQDEDEEAKNEKKPNWDI